MPVSLYVHVGVLLFVFSPHRSSLAYQFISLFCDPAKHTQPLTESFMSRVSCSIQSRILFHSRPQRLTAGQKDSQPLVVLFAHVGPVTALDWSWPTAADAGDTTLLTISHTSAKLWGWALELFVV